MKGVKRKLLQVFITEIKMRFIHREGHKCSLALLLLLLLLQEVFHVQHACCLASSMKTAAGSGSHSNQNWVTFAMTCQNEKDAAAAVVAVASAAAAGGDCCCCCAAAVAAVARDASQRM